MIGVLGALAKSDTAVSSPRRHRGLTDLQLLGCRSGVAGAATDARKTPGSTRHAARAGELATRAATDAWDAALPTWTAARSIELAAGATVAVGIAAASTGVLLENDMRCCAASCRRASRESFRCRHRSNSNRCSNSATNYQRFDQIQFR
jgi:hypothetical protein